MKNALVALLIAASFSVVGCSKDEKPADGKGEAKSGETKTTAAGGGDSTGVAECDEYIKKYEKCLSAMPAETKGAMETAFKSQRDSFKQAASTAAGKTSLTSTCKSALDSLASNPACN